MPKLTIKNFACIDDATLLLKDTTIIIGPQASGKSLICKLNYFFNELLELIPSFVEEAESIDQIQDRFFQNFQEWFTPASWGARAFSIEYTSGPSVIRIYRGRSGVRSKVRIYFSDFLLEAISNLLSAHKELLKDLSKVAPEEFERFYLRTRFLSRNFDKALGRHAPQGQLYIPAGRSFFTSIGKIVTAFDEGFLLDPLVSRFGRLVTNLREQILTNPSLRRDPILATLEKLLAAKVTSERGRQVMTTEDGRVVPFTALSSGQQELFPLLIALTFNLSRGNESVVYIEEPEAHLFPAAQTQLVQMFFEIANRHRRRGVRDIPGQRQIVLTTHSPYVLAKANNLIKAGQLAAGADQPLRRKIERIVPSAAWVVPGSLIAYAINQCQLVSIIDQHGLIDGGYIDSASGEIGLEFDRLMALEA